MDQHSGSEDEEIAQSVAATGWHAVSVPDSDPPFVYTCGLMTTYSHPELILFGMEPRPGYAVLAAMVQLIKTGRSFAEPGVYEGVVQELPIVIREVHPSQHEFYLGYAMGHCRHMGMIGKLKANQVLWSDTRAREGEVDS